MRDVVAELNREIPAFVSAPENHRLRPVTGGYCTPFRGTLFGKANSADVAAELARRSVDVLFVGSNPYQLRPNAKKQIAPTAYQWPSFLNQEASGRFGEVDPAQPDRPAWDPVNSPETLGKGQRSWTLYAEVFDAALGGRDGVAMANVIPWRSSTLAALIRWLKEDPVRFRWVLDFCQRQFALMLEVLRPRLVIAPHSLADSETGSILWTREHPPNHWFFPS